VSAAESGQPQVKLVGVCARCGKHFYSDWAAPGRDYLYVLANDGDRICVCVKKPACRGRQLTPKLYQNDVFARETRQRLLRVMDARPANWKEIGWRSPYLEWQRVDACLTLLSVCYPACSEYACVLNRDESDVIENPHTGEPMIASQEYIARRLNMHQPNVSRAIAMCEALGRWRKQDGKLYYVAAPGEISIDDRMKFAGIDPLVRAATEAGYGKYADQLGGVEKKFVPGWVSFFEELSDPARAAGIEERTGRTADDLRLEMISRVKKMRDSKNSGIQDVRSKAREESWNINSWASIILSRVIEVEIVRTQPAAHSPAPSPVVDASDPVDEGDAAPLNEQYAESPEGEAQTGAYGDVVAPYTEEEVDYLYFVVRGWQQNFPKTDFGAQLVFRDNKADRSTITQVLQSLAGADVRSFAAQMAYHFALEPNSLGKKEARDPNHPLGPRHVGILIEQARRYRRQHGANRGEWDRLQAEQSTRRAKSQQAESERLSAFEANAVSFERTDAAWDAMAPVQQLERKNMARAALEKEERWNRLGREEREREVEAYAWQTLHKELAGDSEKVKGAT
jgi:hypothetical protein